MEELTAIFRNERHRFDDSTVIIEAVPPKATEGQLFDDLVEGVTIKAQAKEGELVPQLSYLFYGHWSTYQGRRGPEKQFLAKTFVRVAPHGQAGVLRYLQQAPKVGPAIARQLWDKFAGDAVLILRESPDVAAAACSLTPEHAAAAAAYLVGERAMESCTIEMVNLLGGRGFPRETGKKAVGLWGNRAADVIRRNPYNLMRFRGCGFPRCHQMYLEQGGDPGRLKCQALCAWYALARDSEGDTWKPRDFVQAGLRSQVTGALVNAPAAVKLAKRARAVAAYRDAANTLWLAEGRRARNEADLARCVAEAMDEGPTQWPDVSKLEISDHQKQEAAKAFVSRGMIALLVGSPGTGKTYTAARILAAIIEQAGAGQIAVAALAGKAAQVITEAMDGYGVKLKATTIHSMLGAGGQTEGEGWTFDHGPDKPLPFRYIVLDEGSMIDTDLMAAVFRARAVGTHVLILGDINQLPPVGHGAPLRDFLRAGLPSGELTEIQRNAGLGVRVCHAIRKGEAWKPAPRISLETGDNLVLWETANGEKSFERIVEGCAAIKAKGKVDPIWDVQVIVAVNEKSPLARKELNKRLQAELNPSGATASGNPFRSGDKIVCSKGTFLPLADGAPTPEPTARRSDDGNYYVANGEQARVLSVQSKITIVEFSAPKRLLKIPHGKQADEGEEGAKSGGVGNFDLAYAISCHKSQGSQWPIVIVALDEYPGARRVCSREWLMTAISRFRQICFLVGKLHVAEAMCRRTALAHRKTFLAEQITELRKGE